MYEIIIMLGILKPMEIYMRAGIDFAIKYYILLHFSVLNE